MVYMPPRPKPAKPAEIERAYNEENAKGTLERLVEHCAFSKRNYILSAIPGAPGMVIGGIIGAIVGFFAGLVSDKWSLVEGAKVGGLIGGWLCGGFVAAGIGVLVDFYHGKQNEVFNALKSKKEALQTTAA